MPPITTGSVKLTEWPIREAIRPWKIKRGAHKKGNRKRRSHAESQQPHSLYPPHENRKIEIRVRERHPKLTEKVGSPERTIDGTNKMSDMSKSPN